MATGTGIVAQKLVAKLEPPGSVTGADVSPEMLAIAKQRCHATPDIVSFIESPAHPLGLPDAAVDAIYCQQGFQFFPDKRSAAQEMHQVLRKGGKIAVTTWCPVDQCVFFGLICDVLRRCDESEIAEMMAVPFDFMPEDELLGHFPAAGFQEIAMETCEMDMVFNEGPQEAYETIYATPIAPKLRALPEEKQAQCRQVFLSALAALTTDGVTRAKMTSLVMTASKR